MKNLRQSLIVQIILLVVILFLVACVISYVSTKNRGRTLGTQNIDKAQSQTTLSQGSNTAVSDLNSNANQGAPAVQRDTETPPPGGAPYVNVQNVSEQTDLPVITSPKRGDTFVLGQTLMIKWNPELIDVSTAELVGLHNRNVGAIQIYHRTNLGDAVSQNGELDYPLPETISIYPDQYQIKLSDYSGKNIFISDVFTIDSPIPLMGLDSRPFYLGSIFGANPSYSIGETMKLNIEAFDGDGSLADTDKGFNVQARLLNGDNIGIWSDNAVYDVNAKIWHLNVPIKANTYRVQVVLYCGSLKLTSSCAQRYGNTKQVDKFINFTLQ